MNKKVEKMLEVLESTVFMEDGAEVIYLNKDETNYGYFRETLCGLSANGTEINFVKADKVKKFINTEDRRDIIYLYENLKFAISEEMDDGKIDSLVVYLPEDRTFSSDEEKEIMQTVYDEGCLWELFDRKEEEEKFCQKFGIKFDAE